MVTPKNLQVGNDLSHSPSDAPRPLHTFPLMAVLVAAALNPPGAGADEFVPRIPVRPIRLPQNETRESRQPARLQIGEVSPKRAQGSQQDFHRDVKYIPKPIYEINTEIAPSVSVTKPPAPEFNKVELERTGSDGRPHMWPDRHFSTESTIALNRPDGGWVVQRLFGPVAPFEHLPLYFEDPGVERCGDSTICLGQSLLSVAHFYGTTPFLPYKMANNPPWRPVRMEFDCANFSLMGKCQRFGREFRLKPAAVQATSIAMLFLLFP